METRYICRFKLTTTTKGETIKVWETLSTYIFNYDYNTWRKRYHQTFTYEGFDNHIIWNSQLLFNCPVPTTSLQEVIASGSSVQDDYATIFLDVIPIRTPPRYTAGDEYLPPKYGRPVTFNAEQEWGRYHVLPRVEDSGRWENIPICKPSLMEFDMEDTYDVPTATAAALIAEDKNGVNKEEKESLSVVTSSKKEEQPTKPIKKHDLVACTWASSYYETRSGFSSHDDGQYRLQQWIEFHLLSGFDHVYIYDNSYAFLNDTEKNAARSTLKDVTDLYSPNQVTHVPWPAKICNNNRGEGDNKGERSSQYAAESSCRLRFGAHTKWIASFDMDEYLIPMGNFTNMKDVLSSVEEKKKKENGGDGYEPKVLIFTSYPAKPRLDFLQDPNLTDFTCGSKKCFQPIVPNNVTYLQTYNCDNEKPPRQETKPAEKQIYQSDFVLLHFVHYSAITVNSALGPDETRQAGMNYMRRAHHKHDYKFDEENEAMMLHSRAISGRQTFNWNNSCKLPNTGACTVGIPLPSGIAPTVGGQNKDENGDVYRDGNGYACNCYVHENIENYWVPRLETALKERGKLNK